METMEAIDLSMFPEPIQPYVPLMIQLALAIVLFVVGWMASKWAHRLALKLLRGRGVDEALSRFLSALVQYFVLAATVVIALEKVGVPTASLLTVLASAGLAIGLALQGSLGHFASGVMLLLFRPFTIEDKITTAGQHGVVEEIGLFATTLLTASNERIIIPNGSITSDTIVNHTVLGQLRASISVGVAYGTDLNQAIEVINKACASCDLVLKDPAPSVAFSAFGASSIDFSVRPWATSDDYLNMVHQAQLAIYDHLNAANIEIPFSQIVVHQAEA